MTDQGAGVAGTVPVQPVIAAAPPTRPGALGVSRSESTVWPAIIGGVAITMGVFGVLAAVWSAASGFMLESMSGFMAAGTVNPFEGMQTWKWPLFAASLALVPIGGLLIAGGVGVCLRRRWSVRVVRAWAVLKIVGGVVLSVITALMQQTQMTVMMAAGAAAGAGGAGGARGAGAAVVGDVMFWVTLVASAAWYAAMPVFVLVWFALPFVRRETKTWTTAAKAGGPE